MSEDGELEVMDLVSVWEILLLDVGEVLEEVGMGEGGEVVDLKVDAEVEQVGESVEGSTGASGPLDDHRAIQDGKQHSSERKMRLPYGCAT